MEFHSILSNSISIRQKYSILRNEFRSSLESPLAVFEIHIKMKQSSQNFGKWFVVKSTDGSRYVPKMFLSHFIIC